MYTLGVFPSLATKIDGLLFGFEINFLAIGGKKVPCLIYLMSDSSESIESSEIVLGLDFGEVLAPTFVCSLEIGTSLIVLSPIAPTLVSSVIYF